MLGDLRLAEPKPPGDLAHRAGPVAQELNDLQPIWLGERAPAQCEIRLLTTTLRMLE